MKQLFFIAFLLYFLSTNAQLTKSSLYKKRDFQSPTLGLGQSFIKDQYSINRELFLPKRSSMQSKKGMIKGLAPIIITTTVVSTTIVLGIKTQTKVSPAVVGTLFFYGAWDLYHDKEMRKRKKHKNTWVGAGLAGIGCHLIQAFVVKPTFWE